LLRPPTSSLRQLGALLLLAAAALATLAAAPRPAFAVAPAEDNYEHWASSHGHADSNARPPDDVRHDMEELMHDLEDVRKAGSADSSTKVDLEASIDMLDAKFERLRHSLVGTGGGDQHEGVVSGVRAEEAHSLAHDLKGMMTHSAGAISSLEEGVNAMERSLGEVTSLQKRYQEDMTQINHMADSARTALERMQRASLRDRGSAARAAASMKQLSLGTGPLAAGHSKLLTIVLLEVAALVGLALFKRYRASKSTASKRNW